MNFWSVQDLKSISYAIITIERVYLSEGRQLRRRTGVLDSPHRAWFEPCVLTDVGLLKFWN
jgi:hypothetical protein